MIPITVVAQIDAATEFSYKHNITLDEVHVAIGPNLGVWASDPDDLDRLAAESLAAANHLRALRAAADAA